MGGEQQPGADDAPPESRRPSIAGYDLESRLAIGGMSEVFLARRAGEPGGPTLVIKRLLADLAVDPEARQAFALEGKIHAAIKHPNVVDVIEVGEHESEPFLVLEHVRGVDAHRLIRRAEEEKRPLAPGVAVHLARELCAAMEAVHGLRDAKDRPLRVVHRDVTPSNVYLSVAGDVKLGDFGIAWTASGRRPITGLKGKYNYLAPEQVSAESLDHRADLFSLAVILSELLLGGPLWEGAGQLAILLAIRDVRIDRLRAVAGALPAGLFEVLERALARAPADRFESAAALSAALAPFAAPPATARTEVAGLVAWARDATSLARRLEGYLLDAKHRGTPSPPAPVRARIPSVRIGTDDDEDDAPVTKRVHELVGSIASGDDIPPHSVREAAASLEETICGLKTRRGMRREVPFTKLIESIATGTLGLDDEVDLGQGMRRIGTIAALARYLPASTGTTTRVSGPGVPDYQVQLEETSLIEVLAWVLRRLGTGALFLEKYGLEKHGPEKHGADKQAAEGDGGPVADARKELYFEGARLVLAASTEPSELLGEYLIKAGKLDRSELELALVVMHKYDGQLGDTLIALGLVDPVAVFQAIRAQGRERVTSAFTWTGGRATFYAGVKPTRNDFRLDLDVPALIMAGLSRTRDDDRVLVDYESRMHERFAQVRPMPAFAKKTTWPSSIVALLQVLGAGRPLMEAVDAVVEGNQSYRTAARLRPAEVLRALEAALAMGVARSAEGSSGERREESGESPVEAVALDGEAS